mmetsp:Transcript_40263/g.104403  ORF Transcript_40263/g.104403 Transcript_40263/m.104403 type:complete len:135 (-) Transcript_40263:1239-1643(-)
MNKGGENHKSDCWTFNQQNKKKGQKQGKKKEEQEVSCERDATFLGGHWEMPPRKRLAAVERRGWHERGYGVECLMSKSIWAIGKKDILQASLSHLFFQERPLFRIENEFNKGESEKNKSMQKKRLSWWWFVGQK